MKMERTTCFNIAKRIIEVVALQIVFWNRVKARITSNRHFMSLIYLAPNGEISLKIYILIECDI